MNQLNIFIAAVGGLVLFLGLVSDWLRRVWWASDPIVAFLFGTLLGPALLGLLNPFDWGIAPEILIEQAARLTIAIGLMGIALRLPPNYVFRRWQPLAVLLGIVMLLMWLCSSLLIYWLLDFTLLEALLLGAIITPTDPVIATSIVTGAVAENNLPGRIRHLISGESGANDGLAYPIVFLPLLLLEHSTGEALSEWFWQVLLWEVGAGVIFGWIIGYGAGRLLEWAERKATIEQTSFLSYSVALTLVVLGAAKLIGSDAILAVFVAGIAFSKVVSGQERSREENIQEALNRFFFLPFFILFGLMVPWQQWWSLEW